MLQYIYSLRVYLNASNVKHNKNNFCCFFKCIIFVFLEIECTTNKFGVNCSENCNQNCGGPNNACNVLHGVCSDGCDNGYQGEKCEARKLIPFILLFSIEVMIWHHVSCFLQAARGNYTTYY